MVNVEGTSEASVKNLWILFYSVTWPVSDDKRWMIVLLGSFENWLVTAQSQLKCKLFHYLVVTGELHTSGIPLYTEVENGTQLFRNT